MIRKMNKKGFTLIELLVVIAIIGVLSGIVVVSMSGAQDSAKDARIKSSLGQLRTATEVYRFGNNGAYDAAMWNETPIATLLSDLPAGYAKYIDVGGTAWCVSSPLSDGTTNWCVSNTGTSIEGTCETTAICTPATP